MTEKVVTRFDHAVIAVDDLEAGVRAYRELGFGVVPGGAHTGRGTHNAIIRFGLDYLELIAIQDRPTAVAAGGNVADLISYLERTGGGLLGFALAAGDIDHVAARWSSEFAPAGKPVAMERMRPDGMRLRWRLLIPGGSAWRKPWPFLIEWHTPDRDRFQQDRGSSHRNSATRVSSVSVLVNQAQPLLRLYETDLGLERDAAAGSSVTSFKVGDVSINVIDSHEHAQPSSDEGLFEICLEVPDVEATGRILGLAPDAAGRIAIPPETACGARIVLKARS